jgi:hypothetical protein
MNHSKEPIKDDIYSHSTFVLDDFSEEIKQTRHGISICCTSPIQWNTLYSLLSQAQTLQQQILHHHQAAENLIGKPQNSSIVGIGNKCMNKLAY